MLFVRFLEKNGAKEKTEVESPSPSSSTATITTTSTSTTTSTTEPAEIKRNPKDSMKSTWRRGDRSTWTFYHWFIETMDLYHVDIDTKVPVFQKTDKVPHMPDWHLHRYVFLYTLIPLAIHHAYVSYFGENPPTIAVALFYGIALNVMSGGEVMILRRLGHKHGFLDGDKHERDGIPDAGVGNVFGSLIKASSVRPLMAVMVAYQPSKVPSSINWVWLPLEIGLFGLTVDFWFYWYHRTMHDISRLWKFHRTHHLTKHPNTLLTEYADGVQEFCDVFIIPTVAYYTLKFAGLPMGFYETWFCHEYLLFAEILGHSGLRVHASVPSPFTWLYRYFDVEVVIEDHDLHHRRGWKSSFNYGKQSRVFDTIFGTVMPRIECKADNIDWENTASFPLA